MFAFKVKLKTMTCFKSLVQLHISG